ncbi:hypothetical protein [Actinoplanes solisilvae]|uniref:hypothetical protein n=1 Tax=Actinoplanes solisilvae TaxID=2486853 RepID=UPI000FDABF30|nr:hypothetical protein [Actinoplanes solisilvae]
MRPRALIAPARVSTALLWSQAVDIRREWFEVGTTTKPADHDTTEEAIASIYHRHGRPRPEFIRVPSPRAAIPYLEGLPTHEDLRACLGSRSTGRPPIASDIAAGLSHLRSALEDDYTEPPASHPPLKRRKAEPWPVLPPSEALSSGLPFRELLTQGVRNALFRSLAGIYLPVRAALSHAVGSVPVGWYGHQDAYWLAYTSALRRLGLTPSRHENEFELWSTLTRSAGWWWPGERRCVLVDRPVILRTEPVPGAWHEEIRLNHIEYADGWSVSP